MPLRLIPVGVLAREVVRAVAKALNGIRKYVKLEQRLLLLAWLNDLLGYRSNRDLLADTKGAAEGFDAELPLRLSNGAGV